MNYPGKYIVVNINDCESLLVFPFHIPHDVFTRMLHFAPHNVISAGFVKIDDADVLAVGESYSLKRKSRPMTDTALLKMTLFGPE